MKIHHIEPGVLKNLRNCAMECGEYDLAHLADKILVKDCQHDWRIDGSSLGITYLSCRACGKKDQAY